jgi:hypothetical protein
MEASTSTHECAPPVVSVSRQTVGRRNDGRLFPMLFLGIVLAMYVAIGYATYALIAVFA